MKAFNNLKVGVKLIGGFMLVALVLASLAGFNYLQLARLGALQDAGAQRARDAERALKTTGAAMMLYRVIADAQLNLDFQETQQLWAEAKQEAVSNLAAVAAAADTEEERVQVTEASGAYDQIVRLFEDEMLPALRMAEASTPETLQMDDEIDGLISAMQKPLQAYAASISA